MTSAPLCILLYVQPIVVDLIGVVELSRSDGTSGLGPKIYSSWGSGRSSSISSPPKLMMISSNSGFAVSTFLSDGLRNSSNGSISSASGWNASFPTALWLSNRFSCAGKDGSHPLFDNGDTSIFESSKGRIHAFVLRDIRLDISVRKRSSCCGKYWTNRSGRAEDFFGNVERLAWWSGSMSSRDSRMCWQFPFWWIVRSLRVGKKTAGKVVEEEGKRLTWLWVGIIFPSGSIFEYQRASDSWRHPGSDTGWPTP